jgi:hypothetical protein
MTAFGDAVPLTLALSLGVMVIGLAVGLTGLAIGKTIQSFTGRPNILTRWADH